MTSKLFVDSSLNISFTHLFRIKFLQHDTGSAYPERTSQNIDYTMDMMQRKDMENTVILSPLPGLYHAGNLSPSNKCYEYDITFIIIKVSCSARDLREVQTFSVVLIHLEFMLVSVVRKDREPFCNNENVYWYWQFAKLATIFQFLQKLIYTAKYNLCSNCNRRILVTGTFYSPGLDAIPPQVTPSLYIRFQHQNVLVPTYKPNCGERHWES